MSMYGIFDGDRRIGTVWKVAGEPPATRWVAFASGDRKQGFPTRKLATEWLQELDKSDGGQGHWDERTKPA